VNLDFSTRPNSPLAQYVFFYREDTAAQFWRGLLIAAVMSCAMTWMGLHAGRAMRKIRR
jgi:hypothetical protein